ncbi:lipocalin family protein [Aquimarina gracilis]|uniref:Lipocalin family protein n=1 Tax=Aquimarina gracilis TaxID=874422 RepID=A0ABU5ZZ69_9FLAO|nr:lipocalin family protein [Aquimarina gracilis]MEB3347105.1 lipocalin family protein [Aquimarina gracilis]
MKKTILTFVATVFLTTAFSCSSDDNDAPVDPIIGKWNQESFTIDGVEQTLTDCDREFFYRFNAEGFEIFVSEFFNGQCRKDNDMGTWERDAENPLKYSGVILSDPDDPIAFELNQEGTVLSEISIRNFNGTGRLETLIFIYTKE